MRIPSSVIVMSLVTAVPFGLAIRDTLGPKKPAFDTGWTAYTPYQTNDRIERESYAEYQRVHEEELAERRQHMLAALDEVHGGDIASMGSMFEGVVLGADAANVPAEPARERIANVEREGYLRVSYAVDTGTLRGVDVQFHGSEYDPVAHATVDTCTTMRNKLRATWGPATGDVWMSPTTGARARFAEDTCTLSFDRALDTTAWLASVSPALVGTSAAPVLEMYGAHPIAGASEDLESVAYWTIEGVGAGPTHTSVEVSLRSGKLTRLKALVTTDAATAAQLGEQISSLSRVRPTVSEPSGEDGSVVMTWKRPHEPTTELSYDRRGALVLYVYD